MGRFASIMACVFGLFIQAFFVILLNTLSMFEEAEDNVYQELQRRD